MNSALPSEIGLAVAGRFDPATARPVVVANKATVLYEAADHPVLALNEVDLTVRQGEFVSLIGHSGCGKSTLLNLIAGLTMPTTGALICAGREIPGPGPERAVVFQNHSLLPWLTCFDNVMLAVERVFGKTEGKAELKARTQGVLEMVGLAHAMHKYPGEVSGGMKQRVGIARALAASPDVLLCDEPTSALDPSTTDDLLELLVKLRDELQVTILIITHDLGVVRRIADRVAVLEGGRIVDSGSVEEVAAHQHSPLLSDIGVEDARGAAELRVSGGHEVAAIPFISRITRELGIDVRLASGGAHAIGEVHVLSATLGFEGEEDRDRAADWLRANGFTVEVGGAA